LDLPGIIEGAAQGKGRGRQGIELNITFLIMLSFKYTIFDVVIAVAKTADLILMMLDATKGPRQRELLEIELEAGTHPIVIFISYLYIL
jgi:uncharacterized protein